MESLRDIRSVNTQIPDDKYYFLNRGNLMEQFQIQLSKKQKRFSAFLKSRSNFEHFEKKKWPSKFSYFRIYGL